jgi:ABC-type branched-subunit amino acid transport system substrate-binding protein
MKNLIQTGFMALIFVLALAGCDNKPEGTTESAKATGDQVVAGATDEAQKTEEAPSIPKLKTGKGVDATKKVITLGALNDESGPAAPVGKGFAQGKRIAVQVANEENMLGDGWKLELIERDHGYNPQKSVQSYMEIKDDVLFIATSFGTPNTLPLRPMLDRDKIMAFPASLSSKMAEHKNTPPLGPSYEYEAMRGMDWAVEHAGGADKVKAGIIYQQDDYGLDGKRGWENAAKHHGVTIVKMATIVRGQKDFSAVVTGLKEVGATHVLITALPSATGPILGTAAQLQFMPTWIGNTPAWLDRFFDPKVIPPAVFVNFHLIGGLPYWGEQVPGMDKFLAAFKKYGKGLPDTYILYSYIQGLVMIEGVKRAIEAGDVTRPGYAKALATLDSFTAEKMLQPLTLSTFPYVTGTKTRVLKPVMDKHTWTEVAPYAEPKTKTAGG